jgi:hypothetical protein
MSINTYDIGDKIKLAVEFTDPDTGSYVDPDTVVCRLKRRKATASTPTVTKDGTGRYHAFAEPDAAGDWSYRFEGSGGSQAAVEHLFRVRPSDF